MEMKDKQHSILKYLKGLSFEQVVSLHNQWVELEHKDIPLIHQHNIGSDIYYYYPNDKNEMENDISLILNYEELVEFLITWGDSGCKFDITPYLEEEFVKYCHLEISERYNKSEILDIVNLSDADFLMEDWEDILIYLFDDVITFCPQCGCIIYKDMRRGYIKENNKFEYECDNCEYKVHV
jgi:hypothetical protein